MVPPAGLDLELKLSDPIFRIRITVQNNGYFHSARSPSISGRAASPPEPEPQASGWFPYRGGLQRLFWRRGPPDRCGTSACRAPRRIHGPRSQGPNNRRRPTGPAESRRRKTRHRWHDAGFPHRTLPQRTYDPDAPPAFHLSPARRRALCLSKSHRLSIPQTASTVSFSHSIRAVLSPTNSQRANAPDVRCDSCLSFSGRGGPGRRALFSWRLDAACDACHESEQAGADGGV